MTILKIKIELDSEDEGWVNWIVKSQAGRLEMSGNDPVEEFAEILNDFWRDR